MGTCLRLREPGSKQANTYVTCLMSLSGMCERCMKHGFFCCSIQPGGQTEEATFTSQTGGHHGPGTLGAGGLGAGHSRPVVEHEANKLSAASALFAKPLIQHSTMLIIVSMILTHKPTCTPANCNPRHQATEMQACTATCWALLDRLISALARRPKPAEDPAF